MPPNTPHTANASDAEHSAEQKIDTNTKTTSSRYRIVLLLGILLPLSAFAVNQYDDAYAKKRATEQKNIQHAKSVDDIKFVSLPKGKIKIGCVGVDLRCEKDETGKEQRNEKIDAFALMRTEVTVAMYERCVAAKRCSPVPPFPNIPYCNGFRAGHAEHPINCVSWHNAVAFCRYINARLPSAIELEYATRIGYETSIQHPLSVYPWGDTPEKICEYANVSVCHQNTTNQKIAVYHDTTPVGFLQPNTYGIHDLLGNVWEWTSDWYFAKQKEQKEYAKKTSIERSMQDKNMQKEIRGGSWKFEAWHARTSNRASADPEHRSSNVGFRCAR